jgi:hypothetical protein
MRHGLILTAAAAGAVFLVATSAPSAQAQTWAWCADLAGESGGGGTNCGFATREQCMITLSGVGGWCYPNPYLRSEEPPQRRRRPVR